jgi:asparagine synthase (glutamine-hydrolysing)
MDPSTQGDQPFAQSYFYENESGEQMLRTIYVICNGEIYNYTKLKRQIESKQTYVFKSHSDIEVLLPMYKDYGIHAMTSKLNGEFAFAIYDTILNTVTKEVEYNLFLGRDRFGIRPLFYTIDDQTIAFASEMKALIGVGDKIIQFPPRTWMHVHGNKDGILKF